MNPTKDSFLVYLKWFIPQRLISTPKLSGVKSQEFNYPCWLAFPLHENINLDEETFHISPVCLPMIIKSIDIPNNIILGQYLYELIYSTEFLRNSINSAKQIFQDKFENFLSFHEQIKLLKLIALYLASNSSKE